MSNPKNNSVTASLAGAGLAALVAGCASVGGSSSAAVQSAASGTAVGTRASSASCAPADLKVSQGTVNSAAAGSRYTTLDFTNTSSSACTLSGYPTVALTTSASPGSQVGASATDATTRPQVSVSLAPGATASSTLQIAEVANYPTASCQPENASYLKVTPPGSKAATYLPYAAQGCAKPVFVLGIAAVQPGSNG